jgi:hypothetical protein
MTVSQNNRFYDLQYSHPFGGIAQCLLKTANDATSLISIFNFLWIIGSIRYGTIQANDPWFLYPHKCVNNARNSLA